MIAYIRVDVKSKIQGCGSLRKDAHIPLRRIDIDLLVEEIVGSKIAQKLHSIAGGIVQNFTHTVKPALIYILLIANPLILPVSGKTALGNFIHAFGTNLYLNEPSFGSYDRGMQGFIAIRLGHSDPILQSLGDRRMNIGDDAICLPAHHAFLLGRHIQDDTHGKQIINLLERHLFGTQFIVDRLYRLRPPEDAVRHAQFIQFLPEWCDKFVDILLSAALCFLQFTGNFEIMLRICYLHTQIQELCTKCIESESMRQRCIDIAGFSGNFELLVLRHRPQRAHIV